MTISETPEAIEAATEPKTRKGRTEHKGYTKVANNSTDLIHAARKWDETQAIVEGKSFYVKNEYINWDHYRNTEEYIPASFPSSDCAGDGAPIDPNAVAVAA